MKRPGKPAMTAIVLLCIAAGGSAWAVHRYHDTYHFAVVQEGVLYRDGLRSENEFANAVRLARPRTVVSLLTRRELAGAAVDEPEFCRDRRIRFVNIPIGKDQWPSDADVERFLQIASDPANQPVLVHCAQGVRRTGMMVSAFQQSRMGMNDQQATTAILPFDKRGATLKELQSFVQSYDERRGHVQGPLHLPIGSESE